MSDLPHRDDIPPDLLELLEEKFGEMLPGFKLVFAGDMPEGSEASARNQAFAEALARKQAESMANGVCFDCGAAMPNYQPEEEGWQPTAGWKTLRNMATDEIEAWVCPECDRRALDGIPRPIDLDLEE
jgi:hypothetical protein